MKKIKLMQITHDLAIGGLQRVVVNICKTVDRDRFDVSVLCLRQTGPFTEEIEAMGIPVFSLPRKSRGVDYFSFLKVARILRREKIDVIHTHNTQPLFDGTMGALLSGVKTVVHTDHARGAAIAKRWQVIERLMSQFVYRFVGVSDDTVDKLKMYGRIPGRKLMTIVNGVDGHAYGIDVDKEKKKIELGINGAGPIMGLGVRLSDQKGITYLLKAMPGVIERFPHAILLIAGEGPLEGPLQEEARALGIDRHVRFIGRRLDIPEILKILDVYVLPSLWEGLPMVLLEAMAAGCPVVASDVGGISTAVEHEKNGLLVDSRDIKGLTDNVVYLFERPETRKKYGVAGKRLFNEKFSAKAMTEKYERLYLRNERLGL